MGREACVSFCDDLLIASSLKPTICKHMMIIIRRAGQGHGHGQPLDSAWVGITRDIGIAMDIAMLLFSESSNQIIHSRCIAKRERERETQTYKKERGGRERYYMTHVRSSENAMVHSTCNLMLFSIHYGCIFNM